MAEVFIERETSSSNELDHELELMIQKQGSRVKVVGCGGAGNNTINRIAEVGVVGAETIAINTDADAPIFKLAHYGIIGDLNDVIPKMIKAYKRIKPTMIKNNASFKIPA